MNINFQSPQKEEATPAIIARYFIRIYHPRYHRIQGHLQDRISNSQQSERKQDTSKVIEE